MSAIESPEALALRVLRDHDGPVLGRHHLGVAVARADREQIAAALVAECDEHPGCPGWIRAFAADLGRTS